MASDLGRESGRADGGVASTTGVPVPMPPDPRGPDRAGRFLRAWDGFRLLLQAALGREGQIVLHGADTRNSAGKLGGPGARVDRLDLTRESDHARIHLG